MDMFAGLDKETAERSIFVIDEFDKLCEPKSGTKTDNYSHMVQNELLKLIEGEELTIKNPNAKDADRAEFVVDTSKISFVFCGSFEQLTQLKTKKLEKLYGVHLILDDTTKLHLCQQAEQTHMGVRYLRGNLEKMLDDQMFKDCSKKEYTLTA